MSKSVSGYLKTLKKLKNPDICLFSPYCDKSHLSPPLSALGIIRRQINNPPYIIIHGGGGGGGHTRFL